MAQVPQFTRHHILHYRQEWTLRPEARRLREHPALIVPLDRETHNALHANCPPVPMLGLTALSHASGLWRPGRNYTQSVDNLLIAVEQSIMGPKVHELERALGELVVEAIELQRPYLEETRGIEIAG